MKARELIKLLKGYEDFDLEFDIVTQAYAGARVHYEPFTVAGITQIDELNNYVQLDVQRVEETS